MLEENKYSARAVKCLTSAACVAFGVIMGICAVVTSKPGLDVIGIIYTPVGTYAIIRLCVQAVRLVALAVREDTMLLTEKAST